MTLGAAPASVSALRARVAELARTDIAPRAARHDREGTLDRAAFRRAAELGLLGLTLPVEAGGGGGDATAAVVAHHELARADAGFALAYLAHAILCTHNLFHVADDEQRGRLLPRLLSGEAIGAMGMTEPSGGTDVLAMRTTAERCGDGYVLRGRKTFITNAPDAGVFLVYAKLDGEVTAFVVERGFPGFATGPAIDKLGMRSAPMAELVLDECVVPRRNLLGRERGGLVAMLRNLEIERLCLAAIGLGIAERCLAAMLSCARRTAPDGTTLADDGLVQRHVAESYARWRAASALVYAVAADVGPARWNRLGADAAKLVAAPVAKEVADRALQVLAIAGDDRESEAVARMLRDAKLLEIGGGTIEAHQRNVVRELTKRARAAKPAR